MFTRYSVIFDIFSWQRCPLQHKIYADWDDWRCLHGGIWPPCQQRAPSCTRGERQSCNQPREFCAQIARMALRMLEEIHHFKIPHRPDLPLQLRMGAHSGPCCAGVVGVKFCLFCFNIPIDRIADKAEIVNNNPSAIILHSVSIIGQWTCWLYVWFICIG